ncbi:MAG: putative addiction module antidote protein [Candidatus Latescibacteria bacterium]|jgi:probable addiction module antidote protein|nr:putative addiction module antidote protein [Candidatus Latescibacterota bacterium]MBT5831578.1 putative addiction module antidote protein [Candidatus Latescibacterota bacterium]
MRKLRSFKSWHIEELKDAEKAKVYLEVALEEHQKDGDAEAFLLALRDVAEARGGLGKLAKETGLNRSNIYKALAEEGRPHFQTVEKILQGLGYRLSVEALPLETVSG